MNFQLRTKLMIIPLLTIVAFMAALIITSVWLTRTVWEQELERSSQSQQEIVISNIESMKKQALTVAALAADIPGVEEAYELAGQGLEDDARTRLRKSFDPIHKTVTNILNLDQFQIHFHLPPAKSLLRIWRKPGQKDGGDDLTSFRQTVLDVNRLKKPVTGIEVGRGGFVIRGLAPVRDKSGQHVGSVESMIRFEEICRRSRLNDSDDVAVFINVDQLEIADSIKDKKPPIVGHFAAVYATNDHLVADLVQGDLLDRASRERADALVSGHQVTAFPIQDFTGRSVGVMVFVRDVKSLIGRMRTMNYILIGGCAFLALLIGGFFYRSSSSILQTILKIVDFARKFSQGDLSNRIDLSRRDELGRLAETLNEMADNLQIQENDLNRNLTDLESVFQKVSAVSDQVATGSGQVSDSSLALSQGAAEQAASLEQISGAMAAIASQTKTNAENADLADRITTSSRQTAEKGAEDMENMIVAMADIDKSSLEIAKILKVIEEIAFQTNLLALNASVEAARAGKYGKGFAVVAQEVRNLALRSAKAAKETENLVNNAVKSSATGMDLMQTTSESLRNIVDGIVKVSELVEEIAEASNEQANGVTEINQGLTQVEQVTQQNTASAEQTAAAAEDLSGQAGQLHQLLVRFQGRRKEAEAPRRPQALPDSTEDNETLEI